MALAPLEIVEQTDACYGRFSTVLERMVELERERDREASPMDRDHNNLIRRVRSVPIEELDPKLAGNSRLS